MPAGKILIIDDEPDLRALLSLILRYRNFEVDTAGSLAEGSQKLHESKPTVLVLDLNLPDGFGLNVVGSFHTAYPQMQILVISADDRKEIREQAYAAGVSKFMPKPFTHDQFLSTLQSMAQAA